MEVFKRFLDTVKPDDLPRLDEVVALVLASEGEAGILKRLDNGTLHRAVQRPADGRHRDRPRDALAGGGAAVVGRRRRQPRARWSSSRSTGAPSPTTFTKASLQRLLGLQDRLAVTRLAALHAGRPRCAVRAASRPS